MLPALYILDRMSCHVMSGFTVRVMCIRQAFVCHKKSKQSCRLSQPPEIEGLSMWLSIPERVGTTTAGVFSL